jgi:enamine deaminase RidA (YjgF/YER057c/UK114 family)
MRLYTVLALAGAVNVSLALGQQEKVGPLLDRIEPQVRTNLKELPDAVVAEAGRLTFYVSPLSARGLLTQQTADALSWLLRQANKSVVVKLRVFVAGTGDMRRVRTLVAETFERRHLPLPVLTVIQAGGLPLRGAQVVIEAVAVSPGLADSRGLTLLSARSEGRSGVSGRGPAQVKESLSVMKAQMASSGSSARDVLRATCFLSSLDEQAEVRRIVASEFPRAILNLVRPLRAPDREETFCEAVARAGEAGMTETTAILNGRIVLSGGQMGFGFGEQDARLAYQRLERSLDEQGGSLRRGAWLSLFAVSGRVAEQARSVGREFQDPESPAAETSVVCEDLPALDASFLIEAAAPVRGPL